MDEIEVTDEMVSAGMDAFVIMGATVNEAIAAAIAVSPLYKRVKESEAELAKFQWQGIESAPKDGTSFLGYEAIDETIYVAFYDAKFKGFYLIGDGYNDYKGYPTHWMPLPEPPNMGHSNA